MKSGDLEILFKTYWDEMDHCRAVKAYWALLHVTVCMPDICGALESDDGVATGVKYTKWFNNYCTDRVFNGDECWRMRCKVLHQGRSLTEKAGRYTGFAFSQPSSDGQSYHKVTNNNVLFIDVDKFENEIRNGVKNWINDIENKKNATFSQNVENNIKGFVEVTNFEIPKIDNKLSGIFTVTTSTFSVTGSNFPTS